MSRKGNYIKINRKILNWGWYDDPATKIVFLDLLLHANFSEGEYHGEKLQKGEVVFGRKACAARNGLSERQVRTAIDHLRKSGEISTSKTTNRFSVIKIENWAFYQGQNDKSDQQNDQQATSKRPASDQQTTTSKNEKNEKNEKRERGTSPSPKKARGRNGKVMLTDKEYKDIKDTFENHIKLINHVGDYLANANKEYKDHSSLIWRIGNQDGWAKRKREQTESTRELSAAEKAEIRRQEAEALGL